MPETCDENFLDPQNPLFCIKDKKNLYIQNVGTSKNQRLDPKVCVDSSWLLVFKNGLKKHSSLINDRVIDV